RDAHTGYGASARTRKMDEGSEQTRPRVAIMKPHKQPALPGLAVAPPKDEPLSLTPAKGREEPALWVSKLAVYKDWPPSNDTLLRQVIELRRGLNILWAQPNGSTNEASRLAGHGAGKTTFCRLIRYVLGEEPAGSKGFRE